VDNSLNNGRYIYDSCLTGQEGIKSGLQAKVKQAFFIRSALKG